MHYEVIAYNMYLLHVLCSYLMHCAFDACIGASAGTYAHRTKLTAEYHD